MPAMGQDLMQLFVQDGLVNYSAAENHRSEIDSLVTSYAKQGLDQPHADLINWYNLKVIQQVLDNWPMQSVKDVANFFDGGNISLNDIEHHLREESQDPRIHFALVCGAVGCPPLLGELFMTERLSQQLDSATALALNHPDFIRTRTADSTSVYLSQIFQWYAKDFASGEELIQWINSYRTQPISTTSEIRYYEYNWTLNDANKSENDGFDLATYTPSALLKKGQWEVQLFNNLYSQTAFRNESFDRVDLGGRQTYFTQYLSVLTGIGKSGRWNIGFDYVHRTVRNDAVDESPAKGLLFENSSAARSAPGQFGPKIKFTPLAQHNNLTVMSTWYFPLYKNGESPIWFDHDRYLWWNRIFYDIKKPKWQIFTEADLLLRFKTAGFFDEPLAETPVSVFYTYFPTPSISLYAMTQYNPTLFSSSFYVQSGIGGKYRPSNALEFELLYSDFWISRNNGAGKTWNLGIRWVH